MMQLADAPPLCAEPERDAWLQSLLQRSVRFLLHEMGCHRLEAVILTGSAARGEASVLRTAAGFRLLGDLEFLVIVRAPIGWPAVRRQMLELSRRATHAVSRNGNQATIEFGPAGLVYLRRNMRPSIFAYDLLTHGRVVWGRQNILTEARSFGIEDIPPEDALNLLMNRLLEINLEAAIGHQSVACAIHDRVYRQTKFILDLAGSALAFSGHYISRYSARGRGFRMLLATTPELRFAMPDSETFLTALDQAITDKLEPTTDRLASAKLEFVQRRQMAWGLGLWLWEMRHCLNRPGVDFQAALQGYLTREPLMLRIKGWTKFIRHPLRPTGALSWTRLGRLLLRASPQTLTYAAALLIQAGAMGEAGPDWQQKLASLAPVPVGTTDHGKMRQEIRTLWQWLMRNN